MQSYVRSTASAAAFLALAAGKSFGQLVVGGASTTTTVPPAYYIDITTDPNNPTAAVLWNNGSNRNVYGIAADPVAGKLYSTTGARLNVWNYGTQPGAPTLIGGTYRNINGVDTATGFDDYTWANGKLYGWTAFANANASHGIYQLATTVNASNHVIATLTWAETTGNYTFQGLAYNSVNGLFYGLNDDTATGAAPLGIYSIDAFGTGAVTKIGDFPTAYQRMDGLAIGGGKFWLTQDDEANAQIVVCPWDPSTQTYGQTLGLPYNDTGHRGTGATWAPGALTAVPEPACFAAVLGAGLLLRRRRQ